MEGRPCHYAFIYLCVYCCLAYTETTSTLSHIHTHTQSTHIHTHTHTQSTHIHTHTIHTHPHTHIHTHTHTHTSTHTHTHTQQEMRSLEQCESTAKNKAQQLLARARRETNVNSPDENYELMQVRTVYMYAGK